jgi:hypothetical protein
MSLVHSSSGTEEPEFAPALEPGDEDQNTAGAEPLSALGQEAVPCASAVPPTSSKSANSESRRWSANDASG